MASDKKRRKQAKQKLKGQLPPRPFVHPDGDRRRRGGPTVDQALADKETRRTFTGGIPVPDDPGPAPG